jgi:hypothetical protein
MFLKVEKYNSSINFMPELEFLILSGTAAHVI